jgi:hypothetical protein
MMPSMCDITCVVDILLFCHRSLDCIDEPCQLFLSIFEAIDFFPSNYRSIIEDVMNAMLMILLSPTCSYKIAKKFLKSFLNLATPSKIFHKCKLHF